MASKFPVTLPPVRVSQDAADRLAGIAEADGGRSVSSVIRAAVERYVEQLAAR